MKEIPFIRVCRLLLLLSLPLFFACSSGGGGGGGTPPGGSPGGPIDPQPPPSPPPATPPNSDLPFIEFFQPAADVMPAEGTTIDFEVGIRHRGVVPTLAWRLDGSLAGGGGSSFPLKILPGFTVQRTVELEIRTGGEMTKLVWRVVPMDPQRENVPPVIQAAFPRPQIALVPDEESLFAVFATDWDLTDRLRFRWTVDGALQASAIPSFLLSSAGLGPGPRVVEVLVDDGHRTADAPAPVRSWTVEILAAGSANRSPAIREASPPPAMRISAGSSLLLTISAVDPDQDPLSYSWAVDGVSQSERSSVFLFQAGQSQPRPSTIRVMVGDRGRSSEIDEFEWRIEVDGTAEPPPPPPPPPANAEVLLSWDPVNTDIFGNPRDVSGYRVYISAFPGPFLLLGNVGNTTQARLSNLASGRLYQFVVTSVDASGNESPFSEAASATTP